MDMVAVKQLRDIILRYDKWDGWTQECGQLYELNDAIWTVLTRRIITRRQFQSLAMLFDRCDKLQSNVINQRSTSKMDSTYKGVRVPGLAKDMMQILNETDRAW
jgi:hypothetical protein